MKLILKDMPWPVSLNRMYAVAKGKIILTNHGKFYKNKLCLLVKSEMEKQEFKSIRKPKWVKMSCAFYAPNNRKHDLDNLNKIVWDSLEMAKVFTCDSQILDFHSKKILSKYPHDGFFDMIVSECEPVYY